MTNLLMPIQNAHENPRLEFRDGQFLFASTNQAGGHVERLISAEAAREAFTSVPIDSGWLRPEVVRWGQGRIGEWAIAYIPPQVHELELTKETATDTGWKLETEVDRISAPLPGLIFFGISNQYHIWAVKTDKLDPYQEIYRCPLPNVEASGLICWGPFKPPRCTAKSIFDAFELFIKSTFNNHRCNGKSKSQNDDVRIVLRDLASAPPPVTHPSQVVQYANELLNWNYPVQDLVRQVEHTGITLDKQIRAFFEAGEVTGFSILQEEEVNG